MRQDRNTEHPDEMPWDDDADEEWVEDEGADDSSAELLACPSCGRPVHEDTQQCPHCGDWIIPVYSQSRGRRLLWIAAVVLMIFGLVMFAVR